MAIYFQGALVIILGELGSKLIVLGIKGALTKSKIKGKASILFDFFKFLLLLGDSIPDPPCKF